MKKKDLTEEFLIDMWLKKYHNTTIKELLIKHPSWGEDPQAHTREFYEIYQVTQEQCDEWEKEAKKIVRKTLGLSKKYVDRSFSSTALNTAPRVKQSKDKDNGT